MDKYFVIGPFEDGFFYVAYRYSFAAIAVPVIQFSNEKNALEYCANANDSHNKRQVSQGF